MRRELCICSLMEPVTLATKVVFIITKREFKVPTNTGRLAAKLLFNSVVLIHGDCDQPYDLNKHISADGNNFLLYPDAEAISLDAAFSAKLSGPCTLIVPDGNWRQTSKMRRRNPILAAMPIVKVPEGNASNYLVRKESKSGGLATIEAVARSLGAIESETAQNKLEFVFHEMVSRTLSSRGTGKIEI